MTRYDTRDDPVHWTARDGRVLPVDGTHVLERRNGELVAMRDGKPCSVCSLTKTRERADRFMVGQQVEWSYGKGRATGMVLAIARSRVQVRWQARKGPRAIWKSAVELRVAVPT